MKMPALSINNLRKSYNSNTAVDGVSFDIEEGEIFGLLGPNGAGKSSIINMIGGVTRIDSGTISIYGLDNQKDYRITRSITGIMHQEVVIEQFFNIGKCLELHSGYYGVPDDPEWRNLLIDKLDLRPHLSKMFVKLSGGMKRRVMVAKALSHKPRLLILDEPTAGVDVELRREMWKFLREINKKGTSILLTTHYIEEAEQMCGRIAILNHGKIVAMDETPKMLRMLESDKLIITLSSSIDELPDKLKRENISISDDGLKLKCDVKTGEEMAEIISLARDCSLNIHEIDTVKPALEDVFLSFTSQGQNG